jgi:hypothetical protein
MPAGMTKGQASKVLRLWKPVSASSLWLARYESRMISGR